MSIAYHVRAAGEIKLNYEWEDCKIIPKEQLRGVGSGLVINDWLRQIAS